MAMEKLYGTQRGAEQVSAQLNEAVKYKGDTVESLADDINKLPAELQQPTLTAAMLYLKLDVKTDTAFTRVLHRQQAVAEQLLQLLRVTPEQRIELDVKVSELQAARLQAEGKTLTLKPTLRLLLANLSALFLLLIFWRNQFVDDSWFALLSTCLMLATPIAAAQRAKYLRREFGKQLATENAIVPTLRLSLSPWHYSFWFLHTLLAVALNVQLFKEEDGVIPGVIFFMSLFGYLLFSTLQNSYPWPTPELVETYLAQSGKEEPTQLNADENDEHLAVLTVKLKGLNQRIEAFVLEAALFGALAFSAFVQLISTDLLTLSDITVFLQHLSGLSASILHLQPPAEWADLAAMGDKKNLFSAICMLTLFCSLFFLTVIATRLRFSDLGQRIDTALELARAYNTKEETVLYGTPPIEGRAVQLEGLGRRVHQELAKARILFADSEGVIVLMRYFRDLGVGTFFVILTTSSLIFSPLLAIGFAALYLFTRAYFYLASIRQQIQLLWLRTEELYLRYKVLFTYGPWVLLVLAHVILLSEVQNLVLLLALSFVLVGIAQILLPLLPQPVQETFTDSGISRIKVRLWKVGRFNVGLGQLLLFLGLGLKTIHLLLSNEFIILGSGILAISYTFLGLYPKNKQPWALLVSWGVSSASLGLAFKILYLPSADELLILGATLCGVTCILGVIGVLLRHRFIQGQLIRHSIIFSLCSCLFLYSPYFFIWENASLGWSKVSYMLKRRDNIAEIIESCNLKLEANPTCVLPKAKEHFVSYNILNADSLNSRRELAGSVKYSQEILALAWWVQDSTSDTANLKFSLTLCKHLEAVAKYGKTDSYWDVKHIAALAALRLKDTVLAKKYLSEKADFYISMPLGDGANRRYLAAQKEMFQKLGIRER